MLGYNQVCSNDDPELTLTYFTASSNLVPYAFVWEKGKTMDISETVVVYGIKIGRCSQLNEYMKLYDYQRSRSFIDLGPRSLRFNIFNLLFLRNCLADWSQISCGASMGWGMKVSIQMVYVTWSRWPSCPYMVETLKNLLSWNQKVDDLGSWYVASGARVLEYYQVCSKDDPGLTLTYFMARSNLPPPPPYAFVWEKS